MDAIVRGWFGERYHRHYFDEKTGALPEHPDTGPGSVVFGHFNRARGFGVEHHYPEVQQFVTVLRDPFEMAVSGYFYTRKMRAAWKDASNLPPLQDKIYPTIS